MLFHRSSRAGGGKEQLSQRFRRFAVEECGASPLYRRLAEGVAADSRLLRLAAACPGGQPAPNLLFAAVHYLLLQDPSAPLAAFYPTVSGGPPPPGDPYPEFRRFCLARRDQIEHILRTRRVQTNELGRAAVLLPGLGAVAERTGRPFIGIEVGTSAGLLLAWDRYAYDYGDGCRWGDPASPVVIHCRRQGDRAVPLAHVPVVERRLGIDINPLDITDPDDVLWLRALVWGDQPERMERLTAAVRLLQQDPPQVLAGDALELLPEVLDDLEPRLPACIVHAHTLNQFSVTDRGRFRRLLAEASHDRPVYELSMEYPAVDGITGEEHPRLELRRFIKGGLREHAVLARYQAHGAWIEWLAGEDD